jgi:Phosphotransferase enzyme family
VTAETALAQVREQHGIGLTLEGRCPGGEVGAFYARSEAGIQHVFKWFDAPLSGELDLTGFTWLIDKLGRLREKGYPLPLYWAPLAVAGGVVIVQEAVGGAWRDEVSLELAETVLGLVDLQADAGSDGSAWTDYVRMTLTEGANGYCVHGTLRAHDRATARVLDWIEGVGRSMTPLPSGDLVHLDLHHRNILRHGEQVVAVVDWEGARSGDRVFDLVTFCFGFTHAIAEPSAESRVWERAEELAGADSLAPYVAHMALRRLDWTIRHHPNEIDRLMPFVQRYMRRVA